MVAELPFEIRRQPADLAGEDIAQHPDARRQQVTVGLDRVDQHVQERLCLLVVEIQGHCVSVPRRGRGIAARAQVE
jgi:hypothetical protein